VRFTVTPLGGGRADTARVVDAIVRYLQPPAQPAHPERPTTTPGPERYYADHGEEPGRWIGTAATSAGLGGDVQRDDLAAVLSGRHPRTGERLVTAQGSAARRSTLGAGTHTRLSSDGEGLFSVSDTAAALGLTRREVQDLLDNGKSPPPAKDPTQHPAGHPDGQSLGTHVEPDGSEWVRHSELDRFLDAAQSSVDPEQIRAMGAPEDLLPLGEAAHLVGVTARYLRTLARHYETERDTIDASMTAGRTPRRAYLIAERSEDETWLVSRERLAEFLDRRRPPATRVGFDVTLTTEKSLGVLALLGGDDTRRNVLDSIQSGNDWAMRWMEQRAAAGRVDGRRVSATGWMAASFRHLTSRALDPFPHHHNVIANTVQLPDGTWRALDARGLYRNAKAASALATAEMRHQLTSSLGVNWRRGTKGGWEIDGISPAVIREFSRRRGEIDDALAELEEAIGGGAHPSQIEHIVLRTRPAKNHTPAAELVDSWRARAERHGLTTDQLTDVIHQPADQQVVDLDSLFESLAGRHGICAGGSVFSRTEALTALANHPVPVPNDEDGTPQPLLCGADRLLELTDLFLRSRHVVPVSAGSELLFTTRTMLDLQARIVARYRSGLPESPHPVGPAHLDAALANHGHLSEEQRRLVAQWCAPGHRFQTAIGRAGAGKTTTIAACADAWIASGYRVRGAAVKGEATRTLASTTGIECETVAWFLAHDDPGQLPIDARTILVIDEASTLSDTDLDALMTMAVETGASLRLIGDPAQHGAIAAGGMFRVLCERHPRHTPELATTHRLRDERDREAAEALRDGRIDDAFDLLAMAGHLHVVPDDLAMYRQVLGRWWDTHRAGLDHPMVDRRNSTRRQLNQLAHLLRRVHGELGDKEIAASGGRTFAIGDRVCARAPNRNLHVDGNRNAYVRNGALGTVTNVHNNGRNAVEDCITVDFDGIGAIALPRSFFDHHRNAAGRSEVGIDHAYSLTSYAVQGATHDISTSRIDSTATRAETYVDITRGRNENHLYVTAAADPLDGEALPRLPSTPADTAVADRLARSTGELTAWELAHPDPGQLTRDASLGL
jgi:conjugative relaxase-like TrwC/TraI family protein